MNNRGGLVAAFALLLLGVAVLFGTRDYPSVYGSLGPAFFPNTVAIMLIAFSLIDIISQVVAMKKGRAQTPHQKVEHDGVPKTFALIGLVCLGMVAMVLLMQHVHVLAGISLFFFAYLVAITKLKLVKSLVITLFGTFMVYASIVLLRIPM